MNDSANSLAVSTHMLGKRFRKHWAVRDLELSVPKGSVYGLLGPNGAGKTTTIQMLMGLLPPTSGSMSVLGIDPMQDEVAVRQRVGYVPENHGFYDWMTVDETIGLVAPYHQGWDWTRCVERKKEFDLRGDAKIKELSKGMRAKLGLLLALCFDPDMLVLDEPTGGLDPAARRSFIETVLGEYQEKGKTILVSSHLLNEFAGLIDRVGFVRDGAMVKTATLDELQRNMKRVRIVFPDTVPPGLTVMGARSIRPDGREAVITFESFDPERTPEELKKTGGNNIEIEELTLEDMFVELVGS